MTAPPRPGRPRRYGLDLPEDFANADAARFTALLEELSERLIDMISDLDDACVNQILDGTRNSIAMLVRHLAAAEAGWIHRITGCGIPDDLQPVLLAGRQDRSGELPVSEGEAADLIRIARHVRRDVTIPALQPLKTIDEVHHQGDREMTARGVLMHQVWHWNYHSGQIGFLRRKYGPRYQWTFADDMTGRIGP